MIRPRASVRLKPKARSDLDAIWAYSRERWGMEKANAYARLIARAFDDLAAGSAQSVAVPHIRDGYFRLVAGSHVLFYRLPEPDVIEIVRILHQRMDVARHL